MEAHAAFTNAAVRGIRARSARPGLQRIDAIAKPKPGLAGTQARCDTRADRSGHQICEQRIIGRHRVIATFEAPLLDDPHHAARRIGHDPGDVFGCGWR